MSFLLFVFQPLRYSLCLLHGDVHFLICDSWYIRISKGIVLQGPIFASSKEVRCLIDCMICVSTCKMHIGPYYSLRPKPIDLIRLLLLALLSPLPQLKFHVYDYLT